jgi:hypothetical protein
VLSYVPMGIEQQPFGANNVGSFGPGYLLLSPAAIIDG